MSRATRARRVSIDRPAETPFVRPLDSVPSSLPNGNEQERLAELLTELYRRERFGNPGDAYLEGHAQPKVIRGQVRAFRWYRRYLPREGAVLDWGCNHAPDSCLLRAWAGERLELHGCDFRPSSTFPVFHEFADFEYEPLTDNLRLPYPAERFDAVIASGVLEHTAMDYEALKELYRVLKPQGTLIITYLPNWLSYQEWYLRCVRRAGYHRRRYSIKQTCAMMRHTGFDPVVADYQSDLWERIAGDGWPGRVLDRLVPVRRFASTLRFVARKVHGF